MCGRFETDCWVGSMVSSRQLVWLTVSSLRYVLRGGGRGQKFDYRWQGWGRIRVIIISHKGRQGQVFGGFYISVFFFLLSIVTAERSAVVASAALVEASASPKGSR